MEIVIKGNSAVAQNDAVRKYHRKLWSYIDPSVRAEVGQVIGGIKLTNSGLLAGAHLRGHGGVKRFVESGGSVDDKDEIGTPCSEYIKQFAGYNVDSVIGN
jgi:hypothetical protein